MFWKQFVSLLLLLLFSFTNNNTYREIQVMMHIKLIIQLLLVRYVLATPTILGNQILRDSNYKVLQNHRVAVLTNPTGVFADTMVHIVDEMNINPDVNIICVFGPEHGFRGDKQAETGDELIYIDNSTKLPVYSAYNMNISQISQVLINMNITAIVVDMQDVGVRLYTFIWTMYNVMLAAKNTIDNGHEVVFITCDRPNPLGGLIVDGPMLNMSCCSSGYGEFPITHVHGMTIGELTMLFNTEVGLPPQNIQVIKMLHWNRAMTWKDTSLDWIPPSPNLPSPLSSTAYGATVFLEATTVSEGRGTTTPFEMFGAPFLDAEVG